MSSDERITVPLTQDWPAVTGALADAFRDDPVLQFLLPRPHRRPEGLRRFFTLETRDVALRHGLSAAAEVDGEIAGAALVLPGEQWRMPVTTFVRHAGAYAITLRARIPRAVLLLSAVERRHARHVPEPHRYLAYIGVARHARGRGVGTRMLAPVLADCDRHGLAAYLEASSPDNARLYRRLGFETLETLTAAGSPPLQLMKRRPR